MADTISGPGRCTTHRGQPPGKTDRDRGPARDPGLEAGTALLVRLQREGSTIATTYKKRLQFDLAAYVSSISFGDREGNMTATLGLQGYYDSTFGSDIKVNIVNALATLA